MNNLTVRAISGTVYIAVIVGSILAGTEVFLLLLSVMAVLGVLELERLTVKRPRSVWALLCLLLDLAAAVLTVWTAADSSLAGNLVIIPPAYLLVRGVFALYDRREHPFRNAAWSVMALFYLAMPLAALGAVYANIGASPKLVLTAFIMIWLNDTGAYCVGSTLGRHKMFPRLSPKKSWEGFAGGLAFCLGAGAAAWAWYNFTGWSLPIWLGLGLTVCLFSTWGDLFESMLKRNVGVKDSGNIIPGHGGILDRIDSLLFVAPALLLYVMAFG